MGVAKEGGVAKKGGEMENFTGCSLDDPCNISSLVDLVQNATNLTNTVCNGSMVNGECLVR